LVVFSIKTLAPLAIMLEIRN